MAAGSDEEAAVIALLRQRFDHVSAERVLSGPGLVNLYNALCELGGQPSAGFTAAQITDPKTMAEDACASRAVSMFCAMLGTVAGNLALTLGARGGIYIAGGIVPKLGDAFTQSPFRDRFEDKGRFQHLPRGHPYVCHRSAPRRAAWGVKAARCGVENAAIQRGVDGNACHRHLNRAAAERGCRQTNPGGKP